MKVGGIQARLVLQGGRGFRPLSSVIINRKRAFYKGKEDNFMRTRFLIRRSGPGDAFSYIRVRSGVYFFSWPYYRLFPRTTDTNSWVIRGEIVLPLIQLEKSDKYLLLPFSYKGEEDNSPLFQSIFATKIRYNQDLAVDEAPNSLDFYDIGRFCPLFFD